MCRVLLECNKKEQRLLSPVIISCMGLISDNLFLHQVGSPVIHSPILVDTKPITDSKSYKEVFIYKKYNAFKEQ